MSVSNTVTQNGNTTQGWTLSGNVSRSALLVTQLENGGPGGSGIEISNIVNHGNHYDFTVTVVGSDAVAFSIAFNQQGSG